MPKRKYSSLTGGTGDVNPQWYKLTVQMTAADTDTTAIFPLPTYRLQNSSGRSWVMEILKIQWDTSLQVISANGTYGTLVTLATMQTTTLNLPQLKAQGAVIDFDQPTVAVFNAAAGSTFTSGVRPHPELHDLTDGDGHGMLVATDRLFLRIQNVSTLQTVANNSNCNVLYRWKEVSLEEYIGLVQSQSQQ